MEAKASAFHALRCPLLPATQQHCVVADASSARARGPRADFRSALRARSPDKRGKHRKYDIPAHLFHAVAVGRTTVLSSHAIPHCHLLSSCLPEIFKAADRRRAAISRAIAVGAALTINPAIRRPQPSAVQGLPFSNGPKSAARALFCAASLHSVDSERSRAASQPHSDELPLPLSAPHLPRALRGAMPHNDCSCCSCTVAAPARSACRVTRLFCFVVALLLLLPPPPRAPAPAPARRSAVTPRVAKLRCSCCPQECGSCSLRNLPR